MMQKSIFCLSLIVVATIGCASPTLPELVKAPAPPNEWVGVKKIQMGCPDISGEYEPTPTVAILQKNSSWKISAGKTYDFLLLFPMNRVEEHVQKPDGTASIKTIKGFLIESDSEADTLRITHQLKNSANYVTHTFKKANRDFSCEAGNLVFPEFVKQGGAEGVTLNGRIYRQASITLSGDLLIYEQVRSYKTTHAYYLFKLVGK